MSATKPASQGSPRVGPLIRARRRHLSLTLQELGDAADLSVGYLSQIERDNATPSLGTLAQIAQALGVSLDYFIAMPRVSDSLSRARERPVFSIDGSSIHYEQLGADLPGHELSSFILHVPPGYASETVSHEGEELIHVLEGEIVQMLDDEQFVLRPGDSLHYRGNRPHSWSNQSTGPARLLWVGTLAVFHMTGKPKLARLTPVRPGPSKQETSTGGSS